MFRQSKISTSTPPKSSVYALLPKLIVRPCVLASREASLKQSGEQSLYA
jgi:hypothetical protein